MKRQVSTYTFSPGGAGVGTVTFTNYATIALDHILLVVNTTRGVVIFNFADPALGGTVATNVLTLATSTSGHSSGDKLYIVYDDTDADFDSGAGTSPRQASGLIVPGSGGPVVITGDAANGLDVDVTRVGGTVTVGGVTASGASITANPLTVGARAATANPTAVSDGQVVNLQATKHGKLVVASSPRDLIIKYSATAAATTGETDIGSAGGSGVYLDMTSIVLANTGTSNTKVTIRDEAATAAANQIWIVHVPALTTIGAVFSTPLLQTTSNKKWTFQCTTSTSNLEVTAQFIKNT